MKSGIGAGGEQESEDPQQEHQHHQHLEGEESHGLLDRYSSCSSDQLDSSSGKRQALSNGTGKKRSRNFSSSSRDRLELSVLSLMGSRRDPASQDSLLDHPEDDDDEASPTHTVKIETPSPNSSQFATPSHGLGGGGEGDSRDALNGPQPRQISELIPILVRNDPSSGDQGKTFPRLRSF